MNHFSDINEALDAASKGQRLTTEQRAILGQAATSHKGIRKDLELAGVLSLVTLFGGIGVGLVPGGQALGISMFFAGLASLTGTSVAHSRGKRIERLSQQRRSTRGLSVGS